MRVTVTVLGVKGSGARGVSAKEVSAHREEITSVSGNEKIPAVQLLRFSRLTFWGETQPLFSFRPRCPSLTFSTSLLIWCAFGGQRVIKLSVDKTLFWLYRLVSVKCANDKSSGKIVYDL